MLHEALPILFFFFNDTATTEIYTLSLHDALPILEMMCQRVTQRTAFGKPLAEQGVIQEWIAQSQLDRKSTRLNSSHQIISYAVFCLKKKKTRNILTTRTHTLSP